MRPDFERSRALATAILMKQSSPHIPVLTDKLTFDKKILFDTFQRYHRLTMRRFPVDMLSSGVMGGTIVLPNRYLILYDAKEGYSRRLNWTLAHEVGHIYLGHTTDGANEEIEAHFFAAELLAPECILLEIARRKWCLRAEDIHDSCYVTYAVANRRIETMKKRRVILSDASLLRRFEPQRSVYMDLIDHNVCLPL